MLITVCICRMPVRLRVSDDTDMRCRRDASRDADKNQRESELL
jgi:hypothetical protein